MEQIEIAKQLEKEGFDVTKQALRAIYLLNEGSKDNEFLAKFTAWIKEKKKTIAGGEVFEYMNRVM